ncbi:MAG: UDP-N-acetylmuramate dehydrogenase [Pseudomonadota bacterium]|jgi:UDP-N-acetylmuramate dehydrogenase|nr:UDP-N-acetylmuramate dehydrogenase [Pseudomonadota bacterium]
MPEAYTLVEHAALAPLNTFGVAANARWLAEVRDAAAIPAVLALPVVSGAPVMVLGEGSNVLFAADFPGLILRTAFDRVRALDDDGSTALVRAEAGAGWDALVDWVLARGLAGLENLALIPGLVGAAPIQNIGAYGAEVAESIATVEAWDRHTGRFDRLDTRQCAFAYRDSVFKRDPERWIVTAVEFRLARRTRPRLDYAGVREELAARGVTADPTPQQVADAVRRLRRRKLPDPAVIGNAGSFFKNPVVDGTLAARIRAGYPEAPVHPAGEGCSKLSAAWLIESCGWRGYRDGDAGISAQHALVLVNHGKASGTELLALARRVADSVEQRFGVRPEPEPRIVGARW